LRSAATLVFQRAAKLRILSEESLSDWPKTGDTLFGVGVWKAEALLGAYAGDGFYYYAAAYKEAADALVEAFRISSM
jgi:hypothetical protein